MKVSTSKIAALSSNTDRDVVNAVNERTMHANEQATGQRAQRQTPQVQQRHNYPEISIDVRQRVSGSVTGKRRATTELKDQSADAVLMCMVMGVVEQVE